MARELLHPVTIPVTLPTGTGAADQLTNLIMPYDGEIVDWAYVTAVVATGAGATRTFNMEIGTVDVTGTATAIALADADTIGEVKELGKATAANKFKNGDNISIEVAAGGTAFTAGSGAFIVWIRSRTRGI